MQSSSAIHYMRHTASMDSYPYVKKRTPSIVRGEEGGQQQVSTMVFLPLVNVQATIASAVS